LHNTETGELYSANGTLSSCGSKLCPSCIVKASNRSRKELKLALKNQKLLTGEMYQFVTLTIPNPNLSLIQTREIIDRIWTLFRKRDYFKQKIRGGSKSEEFTLTENGYHYHYHLFCITRFLNFTEFRREWSDCIEIAFREFNLPCKFKTDDGLAMVKIKRLNASVNGLKGAIQEVCKYVTKSDSWEKLPQKDLIEIVSIKRFWRMFELFGSFRTQRNANVVLESPNTFITYLLTKLIVEILKYIQTGEPITILDTKQISDGECSSEIEDLPDKVPKRRKELGWRKYILENGLESYLEKFAEQIEKTRYARRCFLSIKYKYATFRTLDGVSF
jgi:hypothetical protein